MIDRRERFMAIWVFLLEECVEGLSGYTLRVLGIAILLCTATDLFQAFFLDLVVFTVETGFDEHKLSPRLLGFIGLLGLLGLLGFIEFIELRVQVLDEAWVQFWDNLSLIVNPIKILLIDITLVYRDIEMALHFRRRAFRNK